MYEEKEIKYNKRKKEKTKKNNEKKIVASKKDTKDTKKTNNKKKKKFCIAIPPILKRIDYQKLFTKLFILVLIMMLIIFTISRIKKYNEKLNDTFNENIATITSAATKYFEEITLPQNTKDSISFLLDEMKNLNLIDDIKDDNDQVCDSINSYIILTNIAPNEYRLKIYLKCPNKEKIVEQKLVCSEKICNIKK